MKFLVDEENNIFKGQENALFKEIQVAGTIFLPSEAPLQKCYNTILSMPT